MLKQTAFNDLIMLQNILASLFAQILIKESHTFHKVKVIEFAFIISILLFVNWI